MTSRPTVISDREQAVDAVIQHLRGNIVLGLPLGLGKPLRFVNSLYQRARADPSIRLHIVTGLSLQPPQASSSLERRFLNPFKNRLYGAIPELDYAQDAARDALPDNVKVSEFFFQAANFLNQDQQQRDHICTNYTHVVRDLMALGLNAIAQMVTPANGGDAVSLSCNPDLTLELLPLLQERERQGTPVIRVAETNRNLPFLGQTAAVTKSAFDILLDDPASDYPLFSVPQTAITTQDHLIGFYASTLIRDGGTLQVGIGSLGSALIYSLCLRHTQNARWRQLYDKLEVSLRFPVAQEYGSTAPFTEGLYGCSEMMTEGFTELMDAGILTRRVPQDERSLDANSRGSAELNADEGVVMHGGFFLGSRRFYDRLHRLTADERKKIQMTSVNFINDLLDHRFGSQRLKTVQRRHARFVNSAIIQTLNGATVSDGLEDGRVISGVGGQYNFVAMAHELPGARSILTLRSTRQQAGTTVSNIVFSYAHCTIPKHLRDIVITEYGIADLRGQAEVDVYLRLIAIADSRFQPGLIRQAKEAGKIAKDFVPPEAWRNNSPEHLRKTLDAFQSDGQFPEYPFGSDFTDDELALIRALQYLEAEAATRAGKIRTFAKAMLAKRQARHAPLLARMELSHPDTLTAYVEQKMLIQALLQT